MTKKPRPPHRILRINAPGKPVDIEVVSDAEAAKADFVVCLRKGDDGHVPEQIRSTNVVAPCALGCGHLIVHRPYMPRNVQKICLPCALEMSKAKKR